MDQRGGADERRIASERGALDVASPVAVSSVTGPISASTLWTWAARKTRVLPGRFARWECTVRSIPTILHWRS